MLCNNQSPPTNGCCTRPLGTGAHGSRNQYYKPLLLIPTPLFPAAAISTIYYVEHMTCNLCCKEGLSLCGSLLNVEKQPPLSGSLQVGSLYGYPNRERETKVLLCIDTKNPSHDENILALIFSVVTGLPSLVLHSYSQQRQTHLLSAACA